MRMTLLISVEAACGWGSGPGSNRVTAWPRPRNSMAVLTPKVPPPTTKIRLELMGIEELLASANRHFQPVLSGRDGAVPHFVVGAIRVVGYVEINQEFPVGKLLWFQGAPGAIGLIAGQRVNEQEKDPVGTVEQGEFGRLALDFKSKPSKARVGFHIPGGGGHLHLFLFWEGSHLHFEAQIWILREIGEGSETSPLFRGQRAVRVVGKILIFGLTEFVEVTHLFSSPVNRSSAD